MEFKPTADYQSTFSEVIATLMAMLEQKDPLLKEHAERIAGICVNFSKQLFRANTSEIENTYFASLLHDIGKIFLPDDLISKNGDMTSEEREQIRAVPKIGSALLSNIQVLKDVVPVIRHCHEAYDGSGYPDGLKEEEIPIESRILKLVDTFDELVFSHDSDQSLDRDLILKQLGAEAGKKFDRKLFFRFKKFINTADDNVLAAADKTGNESLRDVFLKITQKFKSGKLDLPVLPKIAEEVRYVTGKLSSSTADIAQVIERDAVISVKLISIANSPIYRGVEKIEEVRTAISRMGIRETQNVVAAIAQKSLYQTKNREFEEMLEKLWLHSLATAYASSVIAKHLELPGPEKYFMIGVVHDIGQVLLLKALADMLPQDNPYSQEDIRAGLSEAFISFAKAMLIRWNFNREFIQLATLHASAEFSPDTDRRVLMINVASHLANAVGYSLFDEQDEIMLHERESAGLLKIDESSLDAIGKEVKEIMKNTANLF